MENEEILSTFISEAQETLSKAEEFLLYLEKILQSRESCRAEDIQTLFRFFHNIKGTAGFFELESIISFAHNVETLLDSIRKEEMSLNLEIIDVLIKSVDELKSLVNEIEIKKEDVPLTESATEVLTLLQSYLDTKPESEAKSKKYEIFEDEPVTFQEKIHQPTTFAKSIKKDVRVPEVTLNQILNLMGELVIAESNVTQHPVVKSLANDSLNSALNHLHKILKEFQEVSLSLRMIPLQDLFKRMTRVVRDLQKHSTKQVHLEFVGEETRIDKSIFDQLVDPMVHLVRNAFDHGIESPEEREQKGKPRIGKIELQAMQTGSEVWVIVSDDGRGLEKEKIFNKAVQLGIISADAHLSDEEIYKLIFHSGLSTSTQVTEVSGRGVGMDIVKTTLEKLGGKIEIRSVPEQGVSFILRLPLTLGIMEGTTFKVGNKFFTVPTTEVKEFVGLREKERISLENNIQVIDVRNHFIPIFSMGQILSQEISEDMKPNSIILIFQSNSKEIGIIADEVLGNQTVVIKT
ncbi:MAG: ATP-binding protein, partial [Leptospiraceae bacterium]|nr:ATP-binding protein [Leptospiraceae bacterium]